MEQLKRLDEHMGRIKRQLIIRDLRKYHLQLGDEAFSKWKSSIVRDQLEAIRDSYEDRIPYINREQRNLGHTNWFLRQYERDVKDRIAKGQSDKEIEDATYVKQPEEEEEEKDSDVSMESSEEEKTAERPQDDSYWYSVNEVKKDLSETAQKAYDSIHDNNKNLVRTINGGKKKTYALSARSKEEISKLSTRDRVLLYRAFQNSKGFPANVLKELEDLQNNVAV